MRWRVSPATIGGARRRRYEADSLVIPNRLDVHAGLARHFSNADHPIAPVVATGCSLSVSFGKDNFMASNALRDPPTIRYRVTGMDCSSCAAKIESAAGKIPGVQSVRVSIASQIMTLEVNDPERRLPEVEQAVTQLGYQLARADGGPAGRLKADDDLPDMSHVTPAYRRALWIVVVLNLGYGVVEIVAGFISQSQALKADSLDFIGDGAITLLALLAIGWSIRSRAKVAMTQGLFLGLLGLGVAGATIYRFFVANEPNAELMGLFGVIALIVNVASAVVLIPHRSGNTNARAVWLFSRNDAIGNAAVVLAAGLVAWTGSSWPDLVVAAAIAGLFLHSSWSIVSHARRDLREAGVAPHDM